MTKTSLLWSVSSCNKRSVSQCLSDSFHRNCECLCLDYRLLTTGQQIVPINVHALISNKNCKLVRVCVCVLGRNES